MNKRKLVESGNRPVTGQKKVDGGPKQVGAKPGRKPARPFAATWWCDPAGYQWIEGAYPNTYQYLEFIRLGDDRLQPWINMDDDAYEAWEGAERENKKRNHEDRKTRWLVPCTPNGPIDPNGIWRGPSVTGYDPLRLLNLHRDFAALDTTEESIRGFASKFGWLGVYLPRLLLFESARKPVPLAVRDSLGEYIYGERFEDWAQHIIWMRSLILLADFIRDPEASVEEMHEVIVPDGPEVCFRYDYCEKYPDGPVDLMNPHYLFPAAGTPYEQRDSTSREDHAKNFDSRSYYKWLADSLLKGHMTYLLGALTFPAVDLTPGAQLNLVPKNLLGAMYILFLQELMGRTVAPIRCEVCGKWFSPLAKKREPEKRFQRIRKDRLYCSNACKQAAYRDPNRKKGDKPPSPVGT